MLSSIGGTSRRVAISGSVIGSNWQTGRAAQDALTDLLGTGLVTFEEVTDAGHRIIEGPLDGQPSVTDFPRAYRHRVARFSFGLKARDGVWSAAAGTAVAVPSTNTRYALPQGTAPTSLIIRVMGAATTPTLTVRASDGRTLHAITLATLSGGEWYDLDSGRGVVEKVVAGVRSNGASSVTSGTFPVRMTLGSWNYRESAWPTVEVSSGSAEVLYTKRYW
jgi:hypothetical protein